VSFRIDGLYHSAALQRIFSVTSSHLLHYAGAECQASAWRTRRLTTSPHESSSAPRCPPAPASVRSVCTRSGRRWRRLLGVGHRGFDENIYVARLVHPLGFAVSTVAHGSTRRPNCCQSRKASYRSEPLGPDGGTSECRSSESRTVSSASRTRASVHIATSQASLTSQLVQKPKQIVHAPTTICEVAEHNQSTIAERYARLSAETVDFQVILLQLGASDGVFAEPHSRGATAGSHGDRQEPNGSERSQACG